MIRRRWLSISPDVRTGTSNERKPGCPAWHRLCVHPPTHLLAQIAKALKVSADELLGTAALKKEPKPRNTRLERRLQQIEQLGAKEKRQVMQFLDTIIEHEKL